jgi:hypothetical protein
MRISTEVDPMSLLASICDAMSLDHSGDKPVSVGTKIAWRDQFRITGVEIAGVLAESVTRGVNQMIGNRDQSG